MDADDVEEILEKIGELQASLSFLLDDYNFRILPVSDIPDKANNKFVELLEEITELSDELTIIIDNTGE